MYCQLRPPDGLVLWHKRSAPLPRRRCKRLRGLGSNCSFLPPTAGDGGQAAGFAPSAGGGAGGELLARWRENLAVLAANAAPGAERAVGRLGHRLACERCEVRYAEHMCGCTEQHAKEGQSVRSIELVYCKRPPVERSMQLHGHVCTGVGAQRLRQFLGHACCWTLLAATLMPLRRVRAGGGGAAVLRRRGRGAALGA